MKKLLITLIIVAFTLIVNAQAPIKMDITHIASVESLNLGSNGIIRPTIYNPTPVSSIDNYIVVNTYTGVTQIVLDGRSQYWTNSVFSSSTDQVSIHNKSENLILNRGTAVHYSPAIGVRCYLIRE